MLFVHKDESRDLEQSLSTGTAGSIGVSTHSCVSIILCKNFRLPGIITAYFMTLSISWQKFGQSSTHRSRNFFVVFKTFPLHGPGLADFATVLRVYTLVTPVWVRQRPVYMTV